MDEMITNDLSEIKKSGEISESEMKMYSAQREVYGISDFDMNNIGMFLDEIYRRIIDKNLELYSYYRNTDSDDWYDKLIEMQGLGLEIYCKLSNLYKHNAFNSDEEFNEFLKSEYETNLELERLRKEFYGFIIENLDNLGIEI